MSPSPGCFWCCFDYGSEPLQLFVCELDTNRDEYLKSLVKKNECCLKCSRILLYIMHFAAYYFILYPLILLLGWIPFIGAVTGFLLTLSAFIFSLISYFIILIIAWVFSRPVYAILLSIGVFGLLFVLFMLKKNNNSFDSGNNGNNNLNSGYGYGNNEYKPKWGFNNKNYGDENYADNHYKAGNNRFLKSF